MTKAFVIIVLMHYYVQAIVRLIPNLIALFSVNYLKQQQIVLMCGLKLINHIFINDFKITKMKKEELISLNSV